MYFFSHSFCTIMIQDLVFYDIASQIILSIWTPKNFLHTDNRCKLCLLLNYQTAFKHSKRTSTNYFILHWESARRHKQTIEIIFCIKHAFYSCTVTTQHRRGDQRASLSQTAQLFTSTSNFFITSLQVCLCAAALEKLVGALSVPSADHCQPSWQTVRQAAKETCREKVGHDELSEVLTALWNEQPLWHEC